MSANFCTICGVLFELDLMRDAEILFCSICNDQGGRRANGSEGLGCQLGDGKYSVFVECLEEVAIA